MSKQIRVTVPEEIYKQLEERSKLEYRSLSNQCLVMLKEALNTQPYTQPFSPAPFTPAPAPAPGIPAEPYKITTQTDTTGDGDTPIKKLNNMVTFPPEPKYQPVEAPRRHTTTPGGVAIPQPTPGHTPAPVVEPDNEYYKKIKKGYATLYGENSTSWRELLDLASRPDIKAFMRSQHRSDVEQIITNSYEHTLSVYEFEELLDYIAGRDPDARNL